MPPKISCLIPFHNEGERIIHVLKIITAVNLIDQIVVADDGSTDQASTEIQNLFPNIEIIKLTKNVGKSKAIKKGLALIRNKYVFLCDADLDGLKVKEITQAIKKITTQPNITMIILKRIRLNPSFFLKKNIYLFERISCILSGERILKVADLREIMSRPIKNYQIEVAINQYMIDRQKKVFWMPSSALNNYKKNELGFFGVIKKYLIITIQLISFLEFSKLFRQIKSFCILEAKD